jgi:ribosomal protein S3AE
MKMLFLLLMVMVQDVSAETREQEALRVAMEAALKQSGADKKIEEVVRKYITKDIEETLGKFIGPVKIVVDQKVEFKWEF